MPTEMVSPTPYPDVNALLKELLASVRAVLGRHFVGMYLDGSLTSGDFDQDSDVDFIVVTDEEVSTELFAALKAMHERLATLDTPWAIELEGSYIPQHALRRYDPACAMHPNIERGKGELLKMAHHDEGWVIHRAVLLERGIPLAGPAPQTLIDPISPNQLRQAMQAMLPAWAPKIVADAAQMAGHRGYQSFVVLSLCRVLYTLHYGAVVSKHAAARWAEEALGEQWAPLVERAWEGRSQGDSEAPPEDVSGTLSFARFALERCRQFELPADEGV